MFCGLLKNLFYFSNEVVDIVNTERTPGKSKDAR